MVPFLVLVHFSADAPLYTQLYDALRRAILQGELDPGSKLPSSRQQAALLGVSRNTVLLAYEQLVAEGYAEAKSGSGTYVARALPDTPLTPPRATTPPTATEANRNLSAYGTRAQAARPGSPYPPASLPFDFRYGNAPSDPIMLKRWRRTVTRALADLPLDYDEPLGYRPLRAEIASYLRRNRGVSCTPGQILITSGSQQALDLLTRVLVNPGDRILLEEPHYQGARQVFLASGAILTPGLVDADGMRLPRDAPEFTLAYVTPSHQFPTGAIMPLSRRLELLRYAERSNAYIIEDDYDSEYRYQGKPIPAVQGLDRNGRVIYLGTFSKVLFPALRLGFIVLPEPLLQPFSAAKWLTDRHSSTLSQVALARFMAEGHFERHLRRTRTRNAARHQALIEALKHHFGQAVRIEGTNAGIHVLVWLDRVPIEHQATLVERARAAGVGVYPVTPYYQHPPERVGLLMGYAALDEASIREGMKRLAEVMRILGQGSS